MKWHAVKDKSGTYEIRRNDGEVFGGIVINGKNKGAGFVGDVAENRYVFEFEDGIFSKTVKVFAGGEQSQTATIKLGFTDNGTLETAAGNYEWKSIGASKMWTDAEKNAVMLLDLENDVEKPITVLRAENLDNKCRELLLLSSWYLLVVEYRAGFTNSKLAGMPVKTEEFSKTTKNESGDYADWFDVITGIIID